jgi:uncharacterized metal-binding protein YceD (DUF177 family)
MLFEIMKSKMYKIPFRGLKIGKHQFEYRIDQTFFETYEYDDFINTDIKVTVDLVKKDTMLELYFDMDGTVRVNCDTSGEEYNQAVKGKMKLIVNFGDQFNNEDEDILILPHNEFELDIKQYIYELIVLGVPVKRTHPGILDGTLKSDVLDKLKEFQEQQNKDDIDPRWEKLKGLIKDKNS